MARVALNCGLFQKCSYMGINLFHHPCLISLRFSGYGYGCLMVWRFFWKFFLIIILGLFSLYQSRYSTEEYIRHKEFMYLNAI